MIDKQKTGIRQWSRRTRKIVLISAAFFCLVLAAAYTVLIQPLLEKDKWIYKEETVKKGTLTAGVTESGLLEYGICSQRYDLDLTVDTGDDEDSEEEEETTEKYLKVEEVYASPGQRIASGDALMKFTQDSVDAVRRLLKAALTDAEVAYSEAQSEYNLSLLQARLDYEAGQVSEKYAGNIYSYSVRSVTDSIQEKQAELQALEEKRESLQESLEEAEENCLEALEAYERAKGDLENMGTGNEHVYIPYQTTYLNAKSRYESAKSRVEQAQDSIRSNEEKIQSLYAQIQQAQAKRAIEELEARQVYEAGMLTAQTAEATYTAQLESLKEELAESEEGLEVIRKQLDAFETFVGSDGIVYAEGSGIVTGVEYAPGDTLIKSGALVSYAPPDRMQITVDAAQEDVVGLEVGDSVEILFGAYEDQKYEGVISAIVMTGTSEASATVSYPVTIDVLGDTQALYGGMTADVTFVTEAKENVLYVSRKAVVDQNGKTFVYVDDALGKKVLKEVKTGLYNGVYVEITEGLEEGETVYIASRVSSKEAVTDTDTDNSAGSGSGSIPGQDMQIQWEGGAMEIPSMEGGFLAVPGGSMGGTPE